MTSVISATNHEFYSFPLPITVWTWNKIGIDVIVFTPSNTDDKLQLAMDMCKGMAKFYTFDCEERKEATYSQTSRLFGATVCDNDDEVMITGDVDLAVFGDEFETFKDEAVRVIGADLLSEEMNQFPMCFIGMPVKKWKDIFGLHGVTLQQALDDTVGKLESISFRGDFWGFDQWYAHKKIIESGVSISKTNRAKMPERFALRRYDRDDYFILDRLSMDNVDFHLPRPAYEGQNLETILTILQYHYPSEDLNWIREYASEYRKLIS